MPASFQKRLTCSQAKAFLTRVLALWNVAFCGWGRNLTPLARGGAGWVGDIRTWWMTELQYSMTAQSFQLLEERLRTLRNGGVEIHHPVFGKHEGKFRLRAKVAYEMTWIEWINRISICRRCFSVNKRQQVKVREVVSYCTYRMYVSYEMQDAKCKMQDARCKYLVWYDTIKRDTTNTNTCTSSS